jgi:glycogen debranching enzyme
VRPAWKDGFLAFTLELDARRPVVIRLAVTPVFDGRARPAHGQRFGDDGNPLAALCRRLRSDAPSLSSTNADVAKAWEAAVSDLASLPLGLPSAPGAPVAGVPTYQQFFGRDALTIGIQSAMAFPGILRDSLLATAETQGQVVDDWRDEEPGKILHQADGGPLATLGETPFARYYGDYSAPQDFLLGLATYLLWTGDRQLAHRLLPAVRRVVAWAERYGDGDGDGFLEYDTRSPKGLENQGWKDSGDAIVDQHGRIVDNPIATCEVQAYWYSAQRAAALVFALTRRWRDARRCLREAGRLRERFDRAFWMADEGFYAMALGPDNDQVRSVASNGGHALAAGIVPPERGAAVARRLLAPDLFSGWGVRTLSADHVAYDPFSYHRGSVWPVETGTFVLGLAAYGCVEELHRLTEGMFASTRLFAGSRLPEAIGGVPRDVDHPHPGVYSQANEPHGWSTSSLVLAVQALLGMRPIAPLGLLLVNPQLPPWIPDLRLNGLRVGKARLDLEFRRARRGRTQFRATVREGRLRVLRQPPALSASTTLLARVLAAASSFPRQRSTGERS